MRELLGGKGAGVAEMTRVLGAERVPAGFTITTEACVAYMRADREEPEGLAEQVAEALGRLEEQAGKRLGDPADPLLVSVRSGARESMPGMMDTVLNLGLNESRWPGWRRRPATSASRGTPTGASCRCSATSCRGVPGELFEDAIKARKRASGVKDDTELTVDDLRALTGSFKGIYSEHTGEEFPQDPERAAAPGHPRRVRLLDGFARGRVPAHQLAAGRLGHRGERPADGVRQQGRQLGHRRGLLPRRDHRRAQSRAATSW